MCYFCRNIYSNFIHEKVASRHIFALEEKAPSSKELSMSIQLGGVTIWYIYVYYILLPLLLPLLNTHYITATTTIANVNFIFHIKMIQIQHSFFILTVLNLRWNGRRGVF